MRLARSAFAGEVRTYLIAFAAYVLLVGVKAWLALGLYTLAVAWAVYRARASALQVANAQKQERRDDRE